MAGSLLPQPKQLFQDANWNPLIGGQIFTYAAGTLTPKATYQDVALTIANTNPTLVNARGEVVMFGSGTYRIILKDALGNVIYDVDNIESSQSIVDALRRDLDQATGASLIGYGSERLDQFLTNRIGRVVSSIAALSALDVTKNIHAFVTGYFVAGDGGGGNYRYDASSALAINGGTVIAALGGAGRWLLVRGGLVSQRQFGAVGDGVADDTDALNRWTLYMLTAGAVNQHAVYGASGSYLVTGSGWQVPVGDYLPPMITDGAEQFIVKGNIQTLVTFYTTGGSGQLPTCDWQGIRLDGITRTASNEGVRNNGVCFFNLRGWHFYNLAICAHAYNLKAGSFTEGWVLHEAYFDVSVKTWMKYSIGAGDPSFRSTGVRDFKGNLGPTSGPAIWVTANAVPYMAPMDGTIWNFNPNGIFIQNDSTQMPIVGNITAETQGSASNLLTLATGANVFHQGALVAWNFNQGKFLKGSMIHCREFYNQPGVGQIYLADNTSSTISSAALGAPFSLPYFAGVRRPYMQDSAILTISVVHAPSGYQWQGVYLCISGLTDNVINANLIVSNILQNTAGLPVMAVSQGNASNINVTNASLPAGAKLVYSYQYLHGLIQQTMT
ncbi:hypothetical protein [Janthinobacterium sp. RA13]|uniref:hypothetical protein n=1 Tax=Janthinobacterium sp. RA13 TaxID=1502762 RepID=UPI0005621A9F|nr:hypothetical protein [Janthinobacterium sp. RA13]